MTNNEAKAMVDAIAIMRDNATDAQASMAAAIYCGMRYDGKKITAGTRINWKGAVKKAAVDLWDLDQNNPDNAPTVWADLEYRDGIRIIPEVIDATRQFANGELGWWGDTLMRSKVGNNVYTPEQYPDNWETV